MPIAGMFPQRQAIGMSFTYLTRCLEQIRIAECGAQTENIVASRMLRYGLHNSTVHDNQMLGRRVDGPALARVARIEQQCGALQAHPIALPAACLGQLDLVFLAQHPFLDRQKTVLPNVRGILQSVSQINDSA